MNRTSTTEPAANTYARLLRRLHTLIAEEKGDGVEADVICDQMDAPGHRLTEQERGRLTGLSEDLYSLTSGKVNAPPMSETEKEAWNKSLKNAFGSSDWDLALRLLRHPPSDLFLDVLRSRQAYCWMQMGDLETALVFMRDAQRLDKKWSLPVLLLLTQLKNQSEAMVVARSILDDAQSRLEATYFATVVLLETVAGMPGSEGRQVTERLVDVLRGALSRARHTPRGELWHPRAATRFAVMLGFCLQRLNRRSEAIAVYNDALKRNPADGEILTFRAIATYATDRASALRDCEVAISSGSSSACSIWPFYLLAHDALERRDYRRCEQFCSAGLRMEEQGRIVARLYEWLGISWAMLGRPATLVREALDSASVLDPTSPTLRQNREAVEAVLRDSGGARTPWAVEPLRHIDENGTGPWASQWSCLKDADSALEASLAQAVS